MPDSDRDIKNTTVGFWVGEDDQELLKRIDRAVDWYNSSRSEWIREAAELRLAIEEQGFERVE